MKGGTYIYYFQYYMSEAALAGFLEKLGVQRPGQRVECCAGQRRLRGVHLAEGRGHLGVQPFNACGILCMILGIGASRRLADRFGKRDVFGGALFVSTLFLLPSTCFHPRRWRWRSAPSCCMASATASPSRCCGR